MREVTTVDVWYSPECETRYSVSLCGADGTEVRCVGGSDDADEAFELACEHAEDLGVSARLMPDASGRVTREWRSITEEKGR